MVSLLLTLAAVHQVPLPPSYKLVWADEFRTDGPPNPASWAYEEGFVRNQEHQWYQRENVTCSGGLLIIEGRREEKANPGFKEGSTDWKTNRRTAAYTSGSIRTVNSLQWTYGIWEMRGRIDIRSGLWPAWWSTGSAREWPRNGEIDMMEFYRGTLLANAAWGAKERWKGIWDDSKAPIDGVAREAGWPSAATWSNAFHTWRMEWTKEFIKLSVDGRVLNEIELSKTVNESDDRVNPFHEPHNMILNLAIGGTSGGDPANTRFPARFEVDWVRVYQKA